MNERQDREWTDRDEWSATSAEQEPRRGYRERHPEWDENISEKSSSELENEIRMIRAEMDDTLRNLERKFSPGELLDRALHELPGGPKAFATNLGYSIRDNPLPATLSGIGISWMIAASAGPSREERPHRSGAGREKLREMSHSVGEKFHQAGEKVQGGFSWASEKMHGAGGSASESKESAQAWAGEMGEQSRRQASRMKEGFEQMRDEHPVVLAGLGLAVGALFGAALPSTRTEDRTMGEARDTALSKAKEKGREQAETAEAALRTGLESAREETERRLH